MNQFPPLGPQKGKFSPELRFMLASLLCVLVILGWTAYFGPKPPANAPKTNTPATTAPSAGPGTENQNAATPEMPATVSAATAASASATSDSQERNIVVENEL